MKSFFGTAVLVATLFAATTVAAHAAAPVYIFGRANCEYCAAERTFLDNAGIPYTYYDVVPGTDASTTFDALAKKHNFTNITPVTVIGSDVFQGFDGATSTGAQLISARQAEQNSPYETIAAHLAGAPNTAVIAAGAGCDQNGVTCSIRNANAHLVNLPFYGLADASFFPLWQLLPLLGFLSLGSLGVSILGLIILCLLFLAPERRTFERRLSLVLLGEVLVSLGIFSQPAGAWPVALIEQRAQLVVGLAGMCIAGGYLYLFQRSRRNTPNHRVITTSLVTVLLPYVALVLGAVGVPLVAFVSANAMMQTAVQVLNATPLTFFAHWWYVSWFLVALMLPQLLVVAVALITWHRAVLHHERRTKYFSVVLAVGLFVFSMAGLWLGK